eukprot:gb/GECG01006961.1/.p1 GENE.gb/GECG01006961.1/~~gb/GECG01006961.1/.p1  ORF type:complete len:519 (+),score=50.52 gb/GECG01006961.1/:1-1557(+)
MVFHSLYSVWSLVSAIVLVGLEVLLACIGVVLLVGYIIRIWYFKANGEDPFPRHVTIGFLHPYCNSGGGGERVLWCILKALNNIRHADRLKCVVYTVESASGEEILRKANERFGIDLQRCRFQLGFVPLQNSGHLIEARTWPRFTMLGQSFGSMVLAWQALSQYKPDLFFDTTGFAFTFIIAKLLCGCKVGCYVHYPTVTVEMTQRVLNRQSTYNNDDSVSGSVLKTHMKWLYYKFFGLLYKFTGKLSDLTLVNSSWTKGHIDNLWGSDMNAKVIYPPCNISELMNVGDSPSTRKNQLVSVGQFRPEKDHEKQLKSLQKVLKDEHIRKHYDDIRLLLVGSCRHDEDQRRVDRLRSLCEALKIADHVEFRLNVSWDDLKEILAESKIGVHTMQSEHFGIGVVELMAAGTVTVAHNSGGPKMDIISTQKGKETGFLQDTVDEYANCWIKIIKGGVDVDSIVDRARASLDRFSEQEFCLKCYRNVSPLLDGIAIQKQGGGSASITGVGGLTGTRSPLSAGR